MKKCWYVGELQTMRICSAGRCVGKTINKSLYLVRASNPKKAYEKLKLLGCALEGDSSCESGVAYTFLGISKLSPVYDELTDGCELLDYSTEQVKFLDCKAYKQFLSEKKKSIINEIEQIEKNRTLAGYDPMWRSRGRSSNRTRALDTPDGG
jgi:hypothetical protein